ncbi:MAG: alpha-glucuronidase family glycosyl hydrolase, partial [Mucilaginibacter sp.]
MVVLLIIIGLKANAQIQLGGLPQYITQSASGVNFPIAVNGKTAQVMVDPEDWKGVIRAASDLGDDVRKVTGTASEVIQSQSLAKNAILVGTIGKSRIIDKLIADKKIDVTPIKGKWESFLIQTVDDHLVIVGSDKRGTIFGIYDVSEKIGVSPWYWWADAPVKKSG